MVQYNITEDVAGEKWFRITLVILLGALDEMVTTVKVVMVIAHMVGTSMSYDVLRWCSGREGDLLYSP